MNHIEPVILRFVYIFSQRQTLTIGYLIIAIKYSKSIKNIH